MMHYSFCRSLALFHAPPLSLPVLSPPLILRAPGRLAGPTRTILPSVRPAWTSLPAGLAPCPWSTLRWGWTQSCSKTRCPYCGRSTGILRGYNPPEPPRSLDRTKAERGGVHVEKLWVFPLSHGWISGGSKWARVHEEKKLEQMWRIPHSLVSGISPIHPFSDAYIHWQPPTEGHLRASRLLHFEQKWTKSWNWKS